MPLILLSSAWVAGIFLGLRFSLNPHPIILLIAIAPLFFLFFARRHKKALILTSLSLLLVFLGTLHSDSVQSRISDSSLRFYNDRNVEIRGTVSDDPDVSNKTVHIRLAASEINLDNGWQAITGTAMVFVPSYADYSYGDILQVKGRLETPEIVNGFDYGDYLASEDVYSTMTYPVVEILEKGKGNAALAWIYSVRNRLSETLTRLLSEPQASLAQGMILGIRGNIPESLNTDMSHTGTAHILAISGLNISIIAGILLSLGIWLFGRRRHIYIWLALVAIWLYTLLASMSAPVVRGTIMASLFLIAGLLGRQKSALTSLAFAAAIMVGVSPQILGNASFQMSFMAMFGLIIISPAFQSKGREIVNARIGENRLLAPVASFITDSLSVSLGAIIAVSPVIAYHFGIFAFVSPLATFLILPVLAAIIVSGAIAGAIGLVFVPVAQVIAWITWLFLSYMLLVIEGFARLPSFTSLSPGNSILVWIYYLALGIAIWLFRNQKRHAASIKKTTVLLRAGADKSAEFIFRLPHKWVIVPLAILAILASVSVAAMPDNNLHVSFLDVGEGDAILVQTPAHQNILIDGGPDRQKLGLTLGEKMPFWDRKFDLVILTHPHQDHLYGLIDVIQRYEVKEILSSPLTNDLPAYEEWLKLIREKGIKFTAARGGEQIKLEGGTLKVISKNLSQDSDNMTSDDIDNNSLVMRLDAGKISFLFTADIMREMEYELINRRAELAATVLKVAHHGSDTSTTLEFLAVANPRLAVISVGADNKFGHPSPEIITRLSNWLGLSNIYRTDEKGTIELTTDGESIWLKTAK